MVLFTFDKIYEISEFFEKVNIAAEKIYRAELGCNCECGIGYDGMVMLDSTGDITYQANVPKKDLCTGKDCWQELCLDDNCLVPNIR